MPKQKLNMTVGRFQPFTIGHLNMINDGDAPCIVYRMEDKPMEVKKNGSIKFGSKTYTKDTVKKAVEYIDNPTGDLSEQEKELLKRPFTNELIAKELDIVKKSNKNIVDVVPVVNMFDALDRFNKFITDNQDKYEPQYWMCGDDRVGNYSEMIGKYDELETYLNSGEKIPNVLKDVLTTSTGKGRTEGISGTAVRQALFNKDKEAFKKVMPKGTEKMFDDFIKAIDDFKNKIKSTIKESKLENYIKHKTMKTLKNYVNESFINRVFGIGNEPISIVDWFCLLCRKAKENSSEKFSDNITIKNFKYDEGSKKIIWNNSEDLIVNGETIEKGKPVFGNMVEIPKHFSDKEFEKIKETIISNSRVGRSLKSFEKERKELEETAKKIAKSPKNVYADNRGDKGYENMKKNSRAGENYYQIEYEREKYYFANKTVAYEAAKAFGIDIDEIKTFKREN